MRQRETKGKKVITLLVGLIAMLVLCTSSIWAAEYRITSYDVDMKVSEDQVLKVQENLDVDFSTESHGIYRAIPYRGDMTYEYEGKSQTVRYLSNIEDVEVPGFETDVNTEDGNVQIRIGNEDQLVSGQMSYPLKYTAVVYDDRERRLDQLYWTLTPADSDTTIETASFRIEMPKAFDGDKITFLSGSYGTALEGGVHYRLEGNTIYGETTGPLRSGEAVTLRIELPEGYFTGMASLDWMQKAMWILILLAPVTAALLWFLFGRDRKIVQTVELYPPDGISPAEVGYILDDESDDCDVVSIVLSLAARGFLEIEEEQKDFRLTKKQELPADAKGYEKEMFRGLFASGSSVQLSSLKGNFFETFKNVREQLIAEFSAKSERRIYTKGSSIARVFGMFLMLVPVLAAAILGCAYEYREMTELVFTAVPLILLLIGSLMLIRVYDKRYQISEASRKVKRVVFAVLTAIGLCGFLIFGAVLSMLPSMACAAAASAVTFLFTVLMKQRTAYSADQMGRILGFKEFIRTAELPRLQQLADDKPEYFYSVLPYAYVFGLTDQWAKNFESIALPEPSWYRSSYGGMMFNTYYFGHSLNLCTSSMRSSIAVIPSTDSSVSGGPSSGFSSGGFSGGGMGGGSVGRW